MVVQNECVLGVTSNISGAPLVETNKSLSECDAHITICQNPLTPSPFPNKGMAKATLKAARDGTE